MKNKHIELVKKYLADPKSVTQAELRANRDAAYYAAFSAFAAAADTAADVAYWVKRYEELTNAK